MNWPETTNHGTFGEIETSKYSIRLVSQIILTSKTKIGKCSIHFQKPCRKSHCGKVRYLLVSHLIWDVFDWCLDDSGKE